VTDEAPSRLSLGLHRRGARQALVEHDRVPPVGGAVFVDRRERGFRVERLHRLLRVFRRHEREGAAAERIPQTGKAQLGRSRRRQESQ
jgi:hypothetical protein